jgi:osmotically-inducible protein OsmY
MNVKMTSILASALTALLVAGTSVSETSAPVPLAAEQPDDGAITEKVKAVIAADAALAGADIAVETTLGEVQLNGTVASAGDIQRATALAFSVAGVKKVQNNLKAK